MVFNQLTGKSSRFPNSTQKPEVLNFLSMQNEGYFLGKFWVALLLKQKRFRIHPFCVVEKKIELWSNFPFVWSFSAC